MDLKVFLLAGILFGQSTLPVTDVSRLREQLADKKQPQIQAQAAMLILQQRTPLAEETIRQYFRDGRNPEAFAALAGAVQWARDPRFQQELLEAVASLENPLIRQAAAEALSQCADGKTLYQLRQMADSPNYSEAVRSSAIYALGKSSRKTAFESLLKLLNDPKDNIRVSSRKMLALMVGEDLGENPNAWNEWYLPRRDFSQEAWLEERLAHRQAKLHRIEGELDSTRIRNRNLYQQLYARMAPIEKVPFLLGLIDHEDDGVRLLAANWAGECLPEENMRKPSGEMLLKLSSDTAIEVRKQAVLGLGRWTEKVALDRLLLVMQTDAGPVRVAAARSLANQARSQDGTSRLSVVLPALQSGLGDVSIEVVVESAEGLGALGVPAAVPLLAGLLRHKATLVRKTASQALERIADASAFEEILRAIDDTEPEIRLYLLGALSRAANSHKNMKEADLLRLQSRLEIMFLRDGDAGVRSRAASLLGDFGNPNHLNNLYKAAVTEGDPRIQEKSWGAFLEIIVRTSSLKMIQDWSLVLQKENPQRQLAFLVEVLNRFQSKPAQGRMDLAPVREWMIECALQNQKWLPAWSAWRELPPTVEPMEMDRRLQWLLAAAELALKENSINDALQIVERARPHLATRKSLQAEFEAISRKAVENQQPRR